jgi:hypothetical protein
MNPARDFFEQKVKPSYEDWRAEPLAQHTAKATVGYANDMAERMFHTLNLGEKYGRNRISGYRDCLSDNFSDFGLLRDIADGTKHFHLTRTNRRISSATQTDRGAFTWHTLADRWEGADYTWEETGEILLVTLDSGEQRSLIFIVNNVMSMWEGLLRDNGL